MCCVIRNRMLRKHTVRGFLSRGNNKCFIDIFIGHWNNFMIMFEQDTFGHHLILHPDEYLCDAIGRIEKREESGNYERNHSET